MEQLNIVYRGEVVVKTDHSRVKRYNSGTSSLFRLFSKLITKEGLNELISDGGRSVSFYVPSYIMLYDANVDDVLTYPRSSQHSKLLLDYVSLNSNTEQPLLGKYQAVFTATILHSYLIDKASNRDNLTIALVSGDKETILAAVSFSSETYNKSLLGGGQALVKWSMGLENAKSTGTSSDISSIETTVTPQSMLEGVTAFNSHRELVVGRIKTYDVDDYTNNPSEENT